MGTRMVLGAALGAAVLAAQPAAGAFKYLKAGMPAPEFSLRTLAGEEITSAALREAPASLLLFWATWSPRSEPALRELQVLHERYAARGLRAVAVNLDRGELGAGERARVEDAIRAAGLTAPAATDPGLATCGGFGMVAVPAFALLDAKGVLVFDASGYSASVSAACRERIEVLLGLREAGAAASPAAEARAPDRRALLHYNLARGVLREGNAGRGMSLLERAVEADAGWAPPRVLLGHLLLQQGSAQALARAERLFREAVAGDARDVSACSGLGEALVRLGRLEEAGEVLERAATLDREFTPAMAGRALVLARRGRHAEARGLIDEALQLHPRDAAMHVRRGECLELAGSLPEAAGAYRRAVELLSGAP